jgi:hypothetical protein
MWLRCCGDVADMWFGERWLRFVKMHHVANIQQNVADMWLIFG